jgi:hypothetical protein
MTPDTNLCERQLLSEDTLAATGPMTSVSRAWLAVGVLWFAGGFNFLTRTMITTMHDSVVAALPMTEAQFGLLSKLFPSYVFCIDRDEIRK